MPGTSAFPKTDSGWGRSPAEPFLKGGGEAGQDHRLHAAFSRHHAEVSTKIQFVMGKLFRWPVGLLK